MNETAEASQQSPGQTAIILTLAALGAACVLVTGGPHLIPAGLAALLLTLGTVTTLHYHPRYAHRASGEETQVAGRRSSRDICGCGLGSVYRDALPAWIGQIEVAHTHTDEAITTLAARFNKMSQRVERAAAAAQSGTAMSGGLALLLGDSRQELEATVVSLRAALATKEALQHEVTELSRLTSQLRTLAAGLGNIAEQTNQTALNTARRAQRDRENQDLALVADEIRKLSSLSGETGKRIGETVDAVNAAIANTLEASRQYAEQDGSMANDARQVIEHVIKRFRGATSTLLESSRELREESQAVGQEITQMLVSLQFQEQVTEVLGLVRSDLEQLHRNLAQADTARRHPLTPTTGPHLRPSRAA